STPSTTWPAGSGCWGTSAAGREKEHRGEATAPARGVASRHRDARLRQASRAARAGGGRVSVTARPGAAGVAQRGLTDPVSPPTVRPEGGGGRGAAAVHRFDGPTGPRVVARGGVERLSGARLGGDQRREETAVRAGAAPRHPRGHGL